MRWIPSWIISLFSLPGVVIHELAHKSFCEYFGVSVFKTSYFRFGNPAGYVVHAEPETYRQNFWISAGPLFLSTLAALLFAFTGFRLLPHWAGYLLLWISLATGMSAFPSDRDVENIWLASKEKIQHFKILYLLAFPFVWLIRLANKLRAFWFDFIYALFLIGISWVIHVKI